MSDTEGLKFRQPTYCASHVYIDLTTSTSDRDGENSIRRDRLSVKGIGETDSKRGGERIEKHRE
jgi:hypothetical protein